MGECSGLDGILGQMTLKPSKTRLLTNSDSTEIVRILVRISTTFVRISTPLVRVRISVRVPYVLNPY